MRIFDLDRRTARPQTENQGSINWEGLGLAGLAVVTFAVSAALSRKDNQDSGNASLGQSGDFGESKRLGRATLAALAAPAAAKGAAKLFDYIDKMEPVQSLSAPLSTTQAVSTPLLKPSLVPLWTPPPDADLLRLIPHPSVILAIGKRGAGKTVFGYRLLELNRDRAEPYLVGPSSLQKLLPSWIGIVQRLEDAPHGAVVLLDEAYMTYHARGSMTADGRTIGQAVNLSRQRGQTLIFVVQELRQLDVNVVSQADVVAIKELSEISREFERKELRKVTDRARAAFAATPVQDKRGLTWIHSEPTAFQGLTRNEMPSFWKPALSRSFAEAGSGSTHAAPRRGTGTPRTELEDRARALQQTGHTYGKIAAIMGLPKSTVWDLLNPRTPDVG